jgi:TPR repeat protein
MDDIQLAYGAAEKLGKLYEEGKSFSRATPGYSLTQLRGLASIYCDLLDQDFSEREDLSSKIASLDQRGLLNPKLRRHLRTLQHNGNKGAHPERFDYQPLDFPDKAQESLAAARALVESLYKTRGLEVPEYEVLEVTEDPLKELCYRAMIEADIDAIHQAGVYFKEKADQLKVRDQYFLQDGYGPASRSDIDKAMYWFKQGADSRHPDCMFQYGSYKARDSGLDQQTRREGEQLTLHASVLGHAEAHVFIGDCYLNGSIDFVQDDKTALFHFEQAAKLGHPEALGQLGAMYAIGRGCVRNDSKAASYCLKAAELGFPQAQFNLFVLYGTGQGIPVDQQQSLRWLQEAAAQDYPEALFSLGYEIHEGNLPDRPLTDALNYFERSIGTVELRSRAALMYARIALKLKDDKEGWIRAARALQLCMEMIDVEGDIYEQERACLELSQIASSKLRAWLSRNWTILPFDLEAILTCGLFDNKGAPVRNKTQRLAELMHLMSSAESASPSERTGILFGLLREVGVEGISTIERLQLNLPYPVAGAGNRVRGRNEPCWCGSGLKFKRCHGA